VPRPQNGSKTADDVCLNLERIFIGYSNGKEV